MIDQTIDLFGELSVHDSGEKVEQSSSFDDSGWANFQGNYSFHATQHPNNSDI